MHVGKTGAKCKDFKEYVHKCLNKLGLEDRISEVCLSMWCPKYMCIQVPPVQVCWFTKDKRFQ